MKKAFPMLLTLALTATLAGCSGSKAAEPTTTAAVTSEAVATTEAAASGGTTETTTETTTESVQAQTTSDTVVRAGSLKGATSMGLVQLMNQADGGTASGNYEFTMVVAADELLGKMVSGDLDIALVPANVASVLYNKTEGGISVININTLGVLNIVASDDSIKSMADLKGKTLYMTGKGTVPEYVLQYLLKENGLTRDDVTLEFKSEPTEVAAILKEQSDAIGLLPQPFATAACVQNEALNIVLDLTREWDAVQGGEGSQLVTGVTVVRNAFLEENAGAVDLFIAEHQTSAVFANENPDEASELIAAAGIIEKAPVAKKALPYCNITCITGEEMKASLSGYLQILYDQDAKAVGGKLPAEDFYYIP